MINVAVGVITNYQSQVLLTRRPLHVDGGGLWEFPGGKCEANESALEALARELQEEVGLTVLNAKPLLLVPYDYGHKEVMLHVFHVTSFEGEPTMQESQLAMLWVNKDKLDDYDMPKGNAAIKASIKDLSA